MSQATIPLSWSDTRHLAGARTVCRVIRWLAKSFNAAHAADLTYTLLARPSSRNILASKMIGGLTVNRCYLLRGSCRFRMRWGHKWKHVVEPIGSGCPCRVTQRLAWASSSILSEAKCWLTSAVLVRGQRCLARLSFGV